MAIEAMSFALNLNVGDSTRKLVLVGLANHADKYGLAIFPVIDTLAQYACCSNRTVQRHIVVLLAEGYIREGDQSLVAGRAKYLRPIVYDMAMTEAEIAAWREAAAPDDLGRRSALAVIGAGGGRKAAAKKAAKKAALDANPTGSDGGEAQSVPGDNMSPGHDADPEHKPGDKLSPPPGDAHDTGPVPPMTEPGDTGVTQTVREPSLEPSIEPSEPSLRSGSASAPDDDTHPETGQPDLTVIAGGKDSEAESPLQVSYRIVRAFLGWYEEKTNAPVLKKDRCVAALVKEYVGPALESGATEGQIKMALAKCGVEWPSQQVWRGQLREAMGGTNLDRPSQFARPGRVYNDEATWGNAEERLAAAADRTPEQIEADVAEMFKDGKKRGTFDWQASQSR
jgi:hypothetical protein